MRRLSILVRRSSKRWTAGAAAIAAVLAAPAGAQNAAPAAAPKAAPKLIVAISVDQLSSDLFAQYRRHATGGFARLLGGVVFPSAYQSHAATETCPGHSTILTGMRPDKTGIIANSWIDQTARPAKPEVYCAEDPSVPAAPGDEYTPSVKHLRVATLGEMMKRRDPATRVVSVAGKDRAALMMGGRQIDEVWWLKGRGFASLPGRTPPPVVARANMAVAELIGRAQPALSLPRWCAANDLPVQVGTGTMGQGRHARAAGDTRLFRASPAADAAVLSLAAGLVQDMKLGQGASTDLLAIGASATDYVGHAFGTEGAEMCIQIAELDQALGSFFEMLDGWKIDYEVVLTSDHGAHDATERHQQRAMPMAARVAPGLSIKAIGAEIGAKLKLTGPVLLGSEGDVYIDKALPAAARARVMTEALARFRAMPQIAAALPRTALIATRVPTTPPETWTLVERARASFDPERSGDILLLLQPRVTPIPVPAPGYVATHGSPWDYDRRVPLIFWRAGRAGFEQPLSVETVDIAPTLAATIGLPVTGLDGRCLDLEVGPASTCP